MKKIVIFLLLPFWCKSQCRIFEKFSEIDNETIYQAIPLSGTFSYKLIKKINDIIKYEMNDNYITYVDDGTLIKSDSIFIKLLLSNKEVLKVKGKVGVVNLKLNVFSFTTYLSKNEFDLLSKYEILKIKYNDEERVYTFGKKNKQCLNKLISFIK